MKEAALGGLQSSNGVLALMGHQGPSTLGSLLAGEALCSFPPLLPPSHLCGRPQPWDLKVWPWAGWREGMLGRSLT